MKRKFLCIRERNEKSGTDTISAYLIAQLAKIISMEEIARLPEKNLLNWHGL